MQYVCVANKIDSKWVQTSVDSLQFVESSSPISEYHHHESVVNNVNEPINNNYNYILDVWINDDRSSCWCTATQNGTNARIKQDKPKAANAVSFWAPLFHLIWINRAQLLLYRCVCIFNTWSGSLLFIHTEYTFLMNCPLVS